MLRAPLVTRVDRSEADPQVFRLGVAAIMEESNRIAELLASLDGRAHVSERKLAEELGVAVGLVKTYIKRCVKKGLLKVDQAPRRRYTYYMTPMGLVEEP